MIHRVGGDTLVPQGPPYSHYGIAARRTSLVLSHHYL
jgi:hypothetical protein